MRQQHAIDRILQELTDEEFLKRVVSQVVVPEDSKFVDHKCMGGDVILKEGDDEESKASVEHHYIAFQVWDRHMTGVLKLTKYDRNVYDDLEYSECRMLTVETADEIALEITRYIRDTPASARFVSFYRLPKIPNGCGAINHWYNNEGFGARLIKKHDHTTMNLRVSIDFVSAVFF